MRRAVGRLCRADWGFVHSRVLAILGMAVTMSLHTLAALSICGLMRVGFPDVWETRIAPIFLNGSPVVLIDTWWRALDSDVFVHFALGVSMAFAYPFLQSLVGGDYFDNGRGDDLADPNDMDGNSGGDGGRKRDHQATKAA